MTQYRPVLVNIQVARLAAALFVVVHHAKHELLQQQLPGWTRYGDLVPIDGSLGVDIFFVISGLIMIVSAKARTGSWPIATAFARRRLGRVVPLYWLFTGLMIAATLALPGNVSHALPDLRHVAGSLLFYPTLDAAGQFQPVLGVGWTLNYEMLFYAVFAACLLLPWRLTLIAIYATLIVIVLLGTVLPLPAGSPLIFWSSPIILEFLFGMTIGLLLMRGRAVPGRVAGLAVVAGLALLAVATGRGLIESPATRWLAGGVPAALVVAGAALGPQLPATRLVRLLRLGGDASYALYLSHPFTINVVAIAWRRTGLFDPYVFLLGTVLMSLGASVLVHLLVERPLLDLLHKRPVVLLRHPLSGWRGVKKGGVKGG